MWFQSAEPALPAESDALPGRSSPIYIPTTHFVTGASIAEPGAGQQLVLFGMGCFWGAERVFWQADGVASTAVGYGGGATPNPTYHEVCSGLTGHAEVVRVVFDERRTNLEALLRLFWENHDPTQGMRQGADVGTQYRSAIYLPAEPARRLAEASRDRYQGALTAAGRGTITTEIATGAFFYFAEELHQQYLAKNPGGYCGHGATGVPFPA